MPISETLFDAERLERFDRWLNEVTGLDWVWFVKRLAGNDTLATGAHQAGPYIPRVVFFRLFPHLRDGERNPDDWMSCVVDSDSTPERSIRAVWYNQGTRNECRLTNWGGRRSPVLDPDATGSICVFAFHRAFDGHIDACRVWLCNFHEETVFEDRVGSVEPGVRLLLDSGIRPLPVEGTGSRATCWIAQGDMPDSWLNEFPSAREIVAKAVELRPMAKRQPDMRLLQRRDCEYEIFRSLEELWTMPRIREGFDSIDEFVSYGHSVSNRRKSRAGWSLELHTREILEEESISFSHGAKTEGEKRPDFLFPSAMAYAMNKQPLHMLAAKTTCKDRWRQILNEADRIPVKHLITLQEGLSENQFAEMEGSGVRLVVPRQLQERYPESIRGRLLSLSDFIARVK